MSDLQERHCLPCEGPELGRLGSSEVNRLLSEVPGWRINDRGEIERELGFADYHRVMAFVNAVAWIAHTENHHPDLEVGYDKLKIRYRTHFLGGLSQNDFVCAAKVNVLIEQSRRIP